MAAIPKERGNLIREPKKKQGYCGVCDETPRDRVSAEELWVRHLARGVDSFVRITESQ